MNKRLPTIGEWQELIDFCTWEWDDKKKGMKVTGKNGKSIFLLHMLMIMMIGYIYQK